MKTSLGLAVIEQAVAHLGEAHYVYVATPWTGRMGHATTRWLQSLGVGYLKVATSVEAHCEEALAPRFYRRAATAWTARLRPEHQTWCEPGSAGGGHWTPYAATCRNIRQFLEGRMLSRPPLGPATTAEVFTAVAHHYRTVATAKTAMVGWAQAGKVPGVVVTVEGGRARWELTRRAGG